MNEKNKKRGNPKWGGAQEESKLIEHHADKWCKENGYPLQKRKYVYRGKWIKVLGEDLVKVK